MNDRWDLLKHAAVEKVVHVDRDVLPELILGRNQFHGPKYHGERNEHRVVGKVPPDAYSLPKAVYNVALVLGVWRALCQRAVRVEVTRRIEQRGVVAVNRRVVVAHSNIHEAHGPLWNEHALIPIVLDRTMRDPDR